ncbi:BON domain-containing protein [Aporhodopirellula aestuarii]|uniref:BON domain-containing protein n=1 Tax=Aporhodopirellula aestuarii TaxID=2950107 RepID=A0ABT0UC27_9BACT|nr:BON domain-containing protein [Aporhodopirellula aestuarii]MCM2374416.1 BON domain-containing protein [Aporhodopirellula aestuarii]
MFTTLDQPRQSKSLLITPPRRVDPVVEAILQALADSNRCGLREARCRVDQGVATLFGTVDSFYLKQLAQEIVRHVPAVTAVRNKLHVR